jgi:hypothetical protein
MLKEHGTQNPTQLQSEQTGVRGPPDRSHSIYGLPPAVSLGPLQPPVSLKSLVCFINMYFSPNLLYFYIYINELRGSLLWLNGKYCVILLVFVGNS